MRPMVPVFGLVRPDPRPESIGLLICRGLPVPQLRPSLFTTLPNGHSANAVIL